MPLLDQAEYEHTLVTSGSFHNDQALAWLGETRAEFSVALLIVGHRKRFCVGQPMHIQAGFRNANANKRSNAFRGEYPVS